MTLVLSRVVRVSTMQCELRGREVKVGKDKGTTYYLRTEL